MVHMLCTTPKKLLMPNLGNLKR